ncbi:MAG: UDP-N-acetylmuramoyl-tripeptide--D-alanyl-D-alanine ligase, partial [Casimicrobium sp.]
MRLTSEFLAYACAARVIGPAQMFDAVVTDSRKPCPRALFVALKGESFDGHDYVAKAIEAGATGVLVSRDVVAPPHVVVLRVDDTLRALQYMAKAHRERFSGRIVAITGSNGKTSTKQMTASVMRAAFGDAAVLATEGSLNNHIGVPLTLLRLNEAHKIGVIEMGMNHFHELSLLTSLAMPDVAAITNAGPAHLEGVGSLLGVAKAKGEIFEGLQGNGIAVINADDEFAAYWRVIARDVKQSLFGFSKSASMRGDIGANGEFTIAYDAGKPPISIAMSLPGRHNQMNALAVAAIAKTLNVPSDALKRGLETARNVVGRLTKVSLADDVTAIDDSYNANPAS